MKNKSWFVLLGGEALLCIVLIAASASGSAILSTVMSFPFTQIGMGLRILSLSGSAGNMAAIILYAALSLMPLLGLVVLKLKEKLRGEDALLVLLSTVLFAVLYLMTNPGDIEDIFHGAAGLPVGKAFLGGAVYSVLLGWLVLRALRLFFASGTDKLYKYLNALLFLVSVILIYAISGAALGGLIDSFAQLLAGNQGNESLLGTSRVFLVLQYVVDILPYIMDLLIVFLSSRLLSSMQNDRFSDTAIDTAEKLSRFCKLALTVIVLSQVAFNMLQLVFVKKLMVVNGQLNLPVLSIVFVLVVLLLTRYLADSKRLKDDNDLFI